MDAIVQKIGMKNNCTFCGVFRRQALDRGAMLVKADKIVTGNSNTGVKYINYSITKSIN